MRGSRPTLSVVIATKDSASLLSRTLEALDRQELGESGVEIVVVDYGSSDDTLERVRCRAAHARIPIRLLELRRGNAAQALNAGVKASAGEILLFLGEDAEPANTKLLARHIELHTTRPEERYAVTGQLMTCPGRRFSLRWPRTSGPVEACLFLNASHTSMKRSLFDRSGGFDERFEALEGQELGARLMEVGVELHCCAELIALSEAESTTAQSYAESREVGFFAARYRQAHPWLPCPSHSRHDPESLRGAALGALAPLLRALRGSGPSHGAVRREVGDWMTEAAFLRGQRSAFKESRGPRRATRVKLALAAILALGCYVAGALSAPSFVHAATPTPGWALALTSLPANLAPGGEGEILAVATNVGAAATSGEVALEVRLPEGINPIPGGAKASNKDPAANEEPTCTVEPLARTVLCKTAKAVGPGRLMLVKAVVSVSAAEGEKEVSASVGGGGVLQSVETSMPVAIQAGPIPFDFLPGFAAPVDNQDGSPTLLAGSHPYQQTVSFGFPTKEPGDGLTNDGHPRDFFVELPRGLIGNPAATPVLCTEVKLTGKEGCPDASQIGVSDITTILGEAGLNTVATSNLYSMVPPPGVAAEVATDVASAGVYVHILFSVRSGEDYGVQSEVRDAIAFGQQPIFNVQAQVWGDPSAPEHDRIRGNCFDSNKSCPVTPAEVPFLTMPTECPGQPLLYEVLADSWEEPEELHEALYEAADLAGTPGSLEGCGALSFGPSIEATPTTSAAESPAGIDVKLHQPQEEPQSEPLGGRAPAALRDATVTFPAGMQVNPSQAAGLEACSEGQVGFEEEGQEGQLYFSPDPQSCPNAAKIGTVKATTPLLIQRDSMTHETIIDPETGAPEPRPLSGSLYLATPFENPFGSLVAVYLVIEDPLTGTTAKLAGEGHLDSATGQISTSFAENPELPVEDIEAHIFGGDRGALITPATCGTYTTTADLTPWSAPEGKVAHPSASFAVSKAPDGGPCPASAPNSPSLQAGTLEPVAGKYSPLLFKLSRQDGSERLGRVEATLPPGLTAKLAGVAQCSDAEIAKAISREAPNQGARELAEPSCPAQSQVGTVTAGAGAGPTPYRITGRAYLAGPYKDAPLSFVIITPAVAGPFDLGAIVVRVAVYIDPATARPRAVSDPLPQLIDGVPSDVRFVSMRIDRPGFSLNPTSCDEMAFEGNAISALGHVASLQDRFQVGGCSSLPYKPKFSARLFGATNRGAHPRLRAVFEAKPGEANTARVSFALPHSEFIDQAHFRTICTRVQFAAHACPKGSVYGHMKAITPLLDQPLEGPIYLRSSSHQLPDVVAALKGPPSLPIELELDGRVDSVHGGVRTIFAAVPDAPVTKAIVTMQGKQKGLFQNSTDICKGTHRVTLRLDGQNGKTHDTRPLLQASCAKKHGKHAKRHGKS